MMPSREKNMKLPGNFIWKELSMARHARPDHSGQTWQFVKTFWGDMKMHIHTVCSLSVLIQDALRQAFKVNAGERPIEHRFESLSKSITQEGNAHLGLGQFDEAKECYESLRALGENSIADQYLKKVREVQERDKYSF